MLPWNKTKRALHDMISLCLNMACHLGLTGSCVESRTKNAKQIEYMLEDWLSIGGWHGHVSCWGQERKFYDTAMGACAKKMSV